jgi:adenylate cyclase
VETLAACVSAIGPKRRAQRRYYTSGVGGEADMPGRPAIYLAVGSPLAAAVPGFYSVITPINTLIFAHTRNLGIYRFIQLLLVLILPWLVMISLGGFRQSSAVVLWAALSPLGTLLIDDLRGTLFWIAGFIALLIIGAILELYLPQANLPQAFIASFYVLNIGAVVSIAFGLLYYFVDRRNFFQQRAEMLLLNILPKEISEALKATPRTIANEYAARQASCLPTSLNLRRWQRL